MSHDPRFTLDLIAGFSDDETAMADSNARQFIEWAREAMEAGWVCVQRRELELLRGIKTEAGAVVRMNEDAFTWPEVGAAVRRLGAALVEAQAEGLAGASVGSKALDLPGSQKPGDRGHDASPASPQTSPRNEG